MREKVTYIAFDGKEFDEEWKCLNYEERQEMLPKAHKAIQTLRKYCRVGACSSCPFLINNGCYFKSHVPSEWEETLLINW